MKENILDKIITYIDNKIDNYTDSIISLCKHKKNKNKLIGFDQEYYDKRSNYKRWNQYEAYYTTDTVFLAIFSKNAKEVMRLFDERENYNNLKDLIKSIKDKSLSSCYYSFDFINKIADEIGLNTKELFYVYLAIAENNIENGVLEKKALVLPENLKDLKYTPRDDMQKLIDLNLMDLYLNAYFLPFTKAKKKHIEIKNVISNCLVEDKDIVHLHRAMKKFVLNEEYTQEDIDDLINMLEKYIDDKKGLNKIRIMLQKVIEPKEEKDDNNDYVVIPVAQEKYKEKEEERQKLREELSNYIDLKTMYPIRILSINEVNRVLYILKFLKYEREDIKEFLIANERNLYTMDIISKYKYLRGRFEHYKERYGLVQEVKDLEDYYNEFNKSNSDDEKKFYKNCLKDGIEFILKYIPTTFDYELGGI